MENHSNNQFNSGTFVLNCESLPPSRRTFVVFGVGRSGTSMVAGVLARLGVNMGENSTIYYEDTEILRVAKAFDEDLWVEKLTPIFERKNREFDVWGFKVPALAGKAVRLAKILRNPYFIFIFRDPVAVAVRNLITVNFDVAHSMTATLHMNQIFVNYINQSKIPLMALSYEKSIINPEEVVRKIAEFSGLDSDDARILDAIKFVRPSPDKYIQASVEKRTPLDPDS